MAEETLLIVASGSPYERKVVRDLFKGFTDTHTDVYVVGVGEAIAGRGFDLIIFTAAAREVLARRGEQGREQYDVYHARLVPGGVIQPLPEIGE